MNRGHIPDLRETGVYIWVGALVATLLPAIGALRLLEFAFYFLNALT